MKWNSPHLTSRRAIESGAYYSWSWRGQACGYMCGCIMSSSVPVVLTHVSTTNVRARPQNLNRTRPLGAGHPTDGAVPLRLGKHPASFCIRLLIRGPLIGRFIVHTCTDGDDFDHLPPHSFIARKHLGDGSELLQLYSTPFVRSKDEQPVTLLRVTFGADSVHVIVYVSRIVFSHHHTRSRGTSFQLSANTWLGPPH